jgi:hypothetical protein
MAKKNISINGEKVETIVALPLSAILVDWKWNTRKATMVDGRVASTATANAGASQTTEFANLKLAIATDGQENAVIVRLNPDPRTREQKPYSLVAGFSRYEALRQLAEEGAKASPQVAPGNYDISWLKNPTIKAIIRQMDEKEARFENLRENSTRSELRGADMAWGIAQLMLLDDSLFEHGGETRLAHRLGKSLGYINQVSKVVKGLMDQDNLDLLTEWREHSKDIGVSQMQKIASVEDAESQREIFRKLASAGRDTSARGQDGWVERAKREALLRGEAIGKLERDGIISVTNTSELRTEKVVRQLVSFNERARQSKDEAKQPEADAKFASFVRQIVAAFSEGYKLGKSGRAISNSYANEVG